MLKVYDNTNDNANDNKDNDDDDDGQRTNFNQKSSLEPSGSGELKNRKKERKCVNAACVLMFCCVYSRLQSVNILFPKNFLTPPPSPLKISGSAAYIYTCNRGLSDIE